MNIFFFGDSITQYSDFGEYFDRYEICNLGCGSDSLQGMITRVPMIASVNPEKVFIMGGINGLRDNNVPLSLQLYSELLDKIIEVCPNAEIFVQSVLPISSNREDNQVQGGICKNQTIRVFNEGLKNLAKEKELTYIDLYPLYELDGSMNPEYSTDGVHIEGNYKIWAEAIKAYID